MTQKQEIKQLAEQNLFAFAKLVNPRRQYGEVHEKVFNWLQDNNEQNQLLLLPRAHMKSHCLAVWCAWWITKHPETTILYISATSQLAEDQLYAIKGMMDSRTYKKYWPEMLDKEEGKREKWAATAISVDHPVRKEEGVRDPTLRTAGLTTNTTGFHADVIIADDVVVPTNAYTEDGRRKCANAMSQMSSIKNPGGFVKACGTRYHPSDQYSIWKAQKIPQYDSNDELIGEEPLWDIVEEVVEVDGEFLWPREVRPDGQAFGFDSKTLSRIKAEYTDRTQFWAQYYNDPNDPESIRIKSEKFQYYDRKYITNTMGRWYYKDEPLNVYAAIDFAFSLKREADYSALVVIGVDPQFNIYVLDIDRFKTDSIIEYYDHILKAHAQWRFRKIRAEATVAQEVIAKDIRRQIKEAGLSLSIDIQKPSTVHSKEERIAAILEPKYDNLQMWHFRGGYVPVLEEEILQARPAHDDIKDSLAAAVEIAVKPAVKKTNVVDITKYSSRFGGA